MFGRYVQRNSHTTHSATKCFAIIKRCSGHKAITTSANEHIFYLTLALAPLPPLSLCPYNQCSASPETTKNHHRTSCVVPNIFHTLFRLFLEYLKMLARISRFPPPPPRCGSSHMLGGAETHFYIYIIHTYIQIWANESMARGSEHTLKGVVPTFKLRVCMGCTRWGPIRSRM